MCDYKEVEKNHLCEYGCGQEGKYQLKNGKFCCSKSVNSCSIKKKIWKKRVFSKRKSRKIYREKPELCDFGCGKEPLFYLKTVDKWCCNKKWQSCSESRIKNGISKKGIIPYNKGIKRTEEELLKQSISMQKRWNDPVYRNKQKETRKTKECKSRFRNSKLGPNNSNYGKPIHPNTLKSLKFTEQKIKERYPLFIEIENPTFNSNGTILVKCRYCGELFEPTKTQLGERLRNLKIGKDICSLFCCIEHKYLSPFSNRTDPKELSEYQKYYRLVLIETGKSLREHGDKIENLHLRGIKYQNQLDHKYSIKIGFKNNIDPKIIGHWKNLEIISTIDNIHKKIKCSIKLEHLLNEIFGVK